MLISSDVQNSNELEKREIQIFVEKFCFSYNKCFYYYYSILIGCCSLIMLGDYHQDSVLCSLEIYFWNRPCILYLLSLSLAVLPHYNCIVVQSKLIRTKKSIIISRQLRFKRKKFYNEWTISKLKYN